jgi:predicted metal-dependent enzyme (double-stranded beta helix superfamily)
MGHAHENHDQKGYGFLVDTAEIRALIDETRRLTKTIRTDAERVEALRPAFARLLGAEGWLPEECARPDAASRMGGSIGQYALYRAEDGSLCLFSLVVPASARTDYRRLDDGRDPARAQLEITRQRRLQPGEFYTLLPPADDIHYVQTVSDTPSISIHLLANDTACIWRHKFDPASGEVTPFRSGYVNAPCPPDQPAS